MPRFLAHFSPVRTTFLDAAEAYWALLKVMVPALLVVKALDALGATGTLGECLSPVMSAVGLPDALGIVWAATLLTNIFTGVVLFFQISQDLALSVEQVTVLGVLMLIGHSLPVEGAVARRAGVPWWTTLVLRLGGAWLLAWLLHELYQHFSLLQEPARALWQPGSQNSTMQAWIATQAQSLVIIFVVIFGLMVTLQCLRHLGIERLIHIAMTPFLKVLGIRSSAANVTVIGVVLGLSYGAGLLIRDVDRGIMSKRDSMLALCFIGLVHSMFEDTLLVMAMGAHLSGILWARLAFGLLVIAVLARSRCLNGLLTAQSG